MKNSFCIVLTAGLLFQISQTICAQPAPEKTTEYALPLPAEPPKELRNEWPPELEREFQARIQTNLQTLRGKIETGHYGNTFFENEKRSYPNAMFDFVMGNRQPALKFLQEEDNNANQWNSVTGGIDFYAAFTLKHQIRKYFLWGEYLDPAYKKRMFEGAKVWTEKDPLHRPHPQFGGKKGDGWTPEYRNSWVDVRGTDNLRAMREVAVYLFAEETGNEATRLLYKERLQSWAQQVYSVGMGEWDSENYLGHTISAYVNLYDFARDKEVRALAKSVLDWTAAAAALDYYRGGWAAPNKRDYGGANRVYGSLTTRFYELYFGDNPVPDPDPEPDQIHIMTSYYRPPLAVMNLARKNFAKPVEVLAAKPTYDAYSSAGRKAPQFWETLYFGRTFQMGSVVSKGAVDDVGPFKLGAWNSQRGVDFFLANSTPVVGHQSKNSGDQVGQLHNLLIWLRPVNAEKTPFYFLLPRGAARENQNGIWFWKLEKTWLALRPIHLGEPVPQAITREEKQKNEVKIVPDEKLVGEEMWQAAPTGDTFCGFALEVGEAPQSYDEFKKAVLQKGALDLSELKNGVAQLTGSEGGILRVTHNANDDRPTVQRQGETRQWDEEIDVYKTIGAQPLITQKWGGQTLTVQANGESFSSSFGAAN